MDAIISVICYKSKTLANGEHPLILKSVQKEDGYHSLQRKCLIKLLEFS